MSWEHRIQTYFDIYLLSSELLGLPMSLHHQYLTLMDEAKKAPTPEIQAYLTARAELMLMGDKPDFQNRLDVVDAIGTGLELEAA